MCRSLENAVAPEDDPVFHEFVDLTWLDPEHLDERALAGAVAVLEAARQFDCPHELSRTTSSFRAELRHGWDGEAPVAAVHRDAFGRVVGVLAVHLPRRDNRHAGYLEITVDPEDRRRGLGRTLYEAGVERLRQEGRTLVLFDCFDIPHSQAFAKSIGADRASAEVKRRQHVMRHDADRRGHHLSLAETGAADYELLRMPETIPDHMMPAVVEMAAAINDAPTDDLDVEDEVYTPERMLGYRESQRAHRRRTYQLVARQVSSGVLAGHTVVGVESEQPWYGHQFDTSVLADHRGKRLGLLLKIGMLSWLAEAEPQLRVIDTWNAASNHHMIAVNQILGYEVVATATRYQSHV